MTQINNVLIGEARFSFLNVFKAKPVKNGPPKFSVCVMIPKSNAKMVAAINECVEAAKKKGLEDGVIKKKDLARLKLPLRDADPEVEVGAKGKEFAGHFFFNANANEDSPPGAMMVQGAAKVPADSSELYSGCYGWVNVNFYAYDNVSVGVGVGLNHILRTKVGDRLDGRISVEDAFGDLDIEVTDDEASGGFSG
jgi:hypothetical protein